MASFRPQITNSKVVADDTFKNKLKEFITQRLIEDGYNSPDVCVTLHPGTGFSIKANYRRIVLGGNKRRIRVVNYSAEKKYEFSNEAAIGFMEIPITSSLLENTIGKSSNSSLVDSNDHNIEHFVPSNKK